LQIGTDPYNLQRFLNAQESTFDIARAELAAGHKRSHWMWFIFPQIKGLGSSPTAQRFAISNLDEGAAYLEHPVLGRRLEECTAFVNAARPCSSGPTAFWLLIQVLLGQSQNHSRLPCALLHILGGRPRACQSGCTSD